MSDTDDPVLGAFLKHLNAYKETKEAKNAPELVGMLTELGEYLKRDIRISGGNETRFVNHRHRIFGAYTEKTAW